jgi:hypothetical protein
MQNHYFLSLLTWTRLRTFAENGHRIREYIQNILTDASSQVIPTPFLPAPVSGCKFRTRIALALIRRDRFLPHAITNGEMRVMRSVMRFSNLDEPLLRLWCQPFSYKVGSMKLTLYSILVPVQ